MRKKDAIGSRPTDRSDWNNAWEIVSRLAAAREATLQEIGQEIGQDRRQPPVPEATRPPANSAAAPATAIEPVDPDQLAHAVAEIEKASAALRQTEPGLEVQPDFVRPPMQLAIVHARDEFARHRPPGGEIKDAGNAAHCSFP